jgi:putative hydrolase of the HAD superfamily
MITHLLFDLDNTLYSARLGLEDRVRSRIMDFLAGHLGTSREAAVREWRQGIGGYGSTLDWLMTEKGFDRVEDYYAAIHPEDEAEGLGPDGELRGFLESLGLPLAILTNSPREHADRILRLLGIADLFPQVFDLRWNSFQGKPRPEVYHRALDALGSRPETTLFIDDSPLCTGGYHALGGPALLLDELNAHPDYPRPKISRLRDLVNFL